MKKFAISLIALAAISGAAFASSNRNYELRESDTYFGKYAEVHKAAASAANVNAFAVVKHDHALTNFERLKKISAENDNGRH
jgi:hypothetical protein